MARPLIRKTAARRKLSLGGLDILDIMALSHGPGGEREHGEELKTLYSENREAFAGLRDPQRQVQRGDSFRHFPGRRFWVWWQCDAPEPRDPEIPEIEQLDRLGLLTDEELRMLERDVSRPPLGAGYR